jgi:hypothetical protein
MRSILFKIKKYLSKSNSNHMDERSLMLSGKILAYQNSKFTKINGLNEVEFSIFSQWGEDGIIDWLISKIPDISNTFIEFGVENYTESNTRFLLKNRNWSGLVIDGSGDNIDNIKKQDIHWKYNLTAKHAFIDCDNINNIITESGIQGDVGLLSIDIDGNDYWVWKSIESVSPAIVVCEYNAVFGDENYFTVPYKKDFYRTEAHYSNLYFGASIRALISLGKIKGYTFIGTASSGVNAFFIRNDLFKFISNSIENFYMFPSQHRESRDKLGNLTYDSGINRSRIIENLHITDLKKDAVVSIKDSPRLYSNEWMNGNKKVFT